MHDTLATLLILVSPTLGLVALVHSLRMGQRTIKRDALVDVQTALGNVEVALRKCEQQREQYYQENILLMQRLMHQ